MNKHHLFFSAYNLTLQETWTFSLRDPSRNWDTKDIKEKQEGQSGVLPLAFLSSHSNTSCLVSWASMILIISSNVSCIYTSLRKTSRALLR